MKKLTMIPASLLLLMGGGCATITSGSDQSIYFDTKPSGGFCSITRDGSAIYPRVQMPESLLIEKDKDELIIVCEKEGYKQTTVRIDSNFETATLGNLLIGGIIGLGVDAMSGAANEYPESIIIPLEEE